MRQRRKADAARRSAPGARRTAHVHLIDISSQALEQTEQRLNGLQHFSVVGHQSTYEEGLRRAVAAREDGNPLLVLLLGSNIGNFDTPAAASFLDRIRAALSPGDLLLMGADLVKPERDLLLAYDDPLGVTAAFNKNLLVRINRELGGTFDLARFAHRAVWNAEQQRIEMHLVSLADQRVFIAACGSTVFFSRARVDLDGEFLQVHAPTRLSTWARTPRLRHATSGPTRKHGLR